MELFLEHHYVVTWAQIGGFQFFASPYLINLCPRSTAKVRGWGPAVTMTMEPSDFQNDHLDHDHNTIFVIKWSWSNGQN
jgi:hypothetical protein